MLDVIFLQELFESYRNGLLAIIKVYHFGHSEYVENILFQVSDEALSTGLPLRFEYHEFREMVLADEDSSVTVFRSRIRPREVDIQSLKRPFGNLLLPRRWSLGSSRFNNTVHSSYACPSLQLPSWASSI